MYVRNPIKMIAIIAMDQVMPIRSGPLPPYGESGNSGGGIGLAMVTAGCDLQRRPPREWESPEEIP